METTVDNAGSFVASQLKSLVGLRETSQAGLIGPAVTISHQTGSGAHEVGERLAEMLQEGESKGAQPWSVLDRQIVEKALEEHHWPEQLAAKLPENKRSYMEEVIDDFLGLRPPSWVLVPHVAETLLHLAKAGHVILIGRGATVVTARLPHIFHVRLIASLATRIERVQRTHKLSAKAAADFVGKSDRGRERYVKANFHARLDDESLYHVVVNTDLLSYDAAAGMIAEGARRCFVGKME